MFTDFEQVKKTSSHFVPKVMSEKILILNGFNSHKTKLLSSLTHPYIFLLDKNSFSEKLCVLLTELHVTSVVTLIFSVTSGVTYRTPCHASGHLVIYRDCYGFERAFFTLMCLYLVLLPAF